MHYPENNRYAFKETSDGVFVFITQSGRIYTVQFRKRYSIFDDNIILRNSEEVYELSFNCENNGDSRFENELVRNTIIFIITTNIISKGDTAVFYFVCDNGDNDNVLINNGKSRSRLFDIYYQIALTHAPLNFDKYNFTLQQDDEPPLHVSLLISQYHIVKESYVQEFERVLNEEFSKGNR